MQIKDRPLFNTFNVYLIDICLISIMHTRKSEKKNIYDVLLKEIILRLMHDLPPNCIDMLALFVESLLL